MLKLKAKGGFQLDFFGGGVYNVHGKITWEENYEKQVS
jgi:hypothetical protein